MTRLNREHCLIIAEAGVNHNGDLDTAFRLCDAAKEAGADAVKFQTWVTERMITKDVCQADYQADNTGRIESQYEMLKGLELSYDDFARIKEYCDSIDMTFMSTADDSIDLEFLISIGIPFIKIGSGDIENIPLLRSAGKSSLPIVLSTGMSTVEEIDRALSVLEEKGNRDVTLLHCTTNYPCPFEDVNLRAMLTLRERFGRPIGYSDHTNGIIVPVAAVAMGACVIEKHLTLDKTMNGPDHRASTEPQEFRELVQSIRRLESAMGDGEKKPVASEESIKKVVTKRIVAIEPISRGELFSVSNIALKRSLEGLPADRWDDIIGTVANRRYNIDEGIES